MKYENRTIDFRSIKEMPSEERPREKMLTFGPLGMSDMELLCLVLGSGSKSRPVQDIAQDLLVLLDERGCESLSVDEIASIPGVGRAKASAISACIEIGRRFSFSKARSCKEPARIFEIVRHYGDRLQEHFLEIMLNGAHELMGVNVVTVGLVNRTLVHPREVFSEPLKLRATAIVLAHNHPSGNLEPSPDDLEVTLRIKRAGILLGIEVLDHIIFSSDGYRSMMESGELL